MNVIEAMQSAVAALDPHDYHDIITNLRAAIAELECTKPVALLPIGSGIKPSIRSTCGVSCITEKEAKEYAPESVLKLFTHPVQSSDSIIEECAAECESQYEHYDGSKHPCFVDADECAAAIRALKGK